MSFKILEDRCKGCGICIEFCPKKVLTFSEKRNVFGYKVISLADPKECTLCGICYLLCPEVVFVEKEEAFGK